VTKFNSKASDHQIEVAIQIEHEMARLKELAAKVDLRFLVYLMEMTHDEAAVIARGKGTETGFATTIAYKD
jgi:hypothetical protein